MISDHVADKDIRADAEVCHVIERHIRDHIRYNDRPVYYQWIGFKLLGLRVALPVDGAVMRVAYWDQARETRYVMKVGKFLNKFFKDRCGLTDHGVQTVGSGVCAELWAGSIGDGVTLYSGGDIKRQYLELDAVRSCMSHKCTNSYLDLYCNNPDKVQLAVVNNGLGQLRALVWTGKKTDGTEVRLLSRPYFSTNAAEAVLDQWADAEGIEYRVRGGKVTVPDIEVVMEYDLDNEWPYVDDLYHVTDSGDGMVTLSNADGDYDAHDTDGGLLGYSEGSGRFRCENCGDSVDEDEANSDPDGNMLCMDCYENICAYCECCDSVTWESEMHCVNGGNYDHVCQSCLDLCYTACGDCGNLVPHDLAVEVGNDDVVCPGCFEDNYTICDSCDEVTKHDKGKSVANGDWVCDSCLDELYFQCRQCNEMFLNKINGGDGLCGDCAMERMERLCSSTTKG